MQTLIEDLCAIRTGVVTDGNEEFFDRVEMEIPLRRFRFASGENHNGWIVPQNWVVKRAKLYRNGVEIFDGSEYPLAIGYYSTSFSGELDWEELREHLVTNPALPDAFIWHCQWQYRPWAADWCFVIPYTIYKTLGPDSYRVELETELKAGEMLVAHSHKQGASDKTVVLNSNNCHPHMANDGSAGTAVLIRLMQWLYERDTYYSYRLVIGPEHLGSVFYLRDLPEAEIDNMVCGIFEEMPSTGEMISAASTFKGGHMIDAAFSNVLRHHSQEYRLIPWRKGPGNDETVWESPGYEIPFVEMTRFKYQFSPFAEYHSNLDTPELMEQTQLEEMLKCLQKVVVVLEENCSMKRCFDGLICLSNPDYDLYMERPDPAVAKNLNDEAENWGHLLDCLFRYMDGEVTLLDIAERHEISFEQLVRYIKRFEAKGLVELERAEIHRELPRRVSISSD